MQSFRLRGSRARTGFTLVESPVVSFRKRKAFTLVELLVVIGIIAILMSVLLPTLASARRAGVQVKCQASLRQMGDAFKMYAIDYKGYWPVMKWEPATVPAGAPKAMTWQAFLFPYLHKGTNLPLASFQGNTFGAGVELQADLSALRGISPLWGCEAFRGDAYFDPGDPVNRYSTGYGMNYHPAAPYDPPGMSMATGGIMCMYLNSGSGIYLGRFYKHTEWLRNGSNRGLIADSNTFFIQGNFRRPMLRSTVNVDPFWVANIGDAYLYVDGMRHLKPGFSKKKVLSSKGINLLFCDGHVTSVDPYEAFNAIMGGGKNILE